MQITAYGLSNVGRVRSTNEDAMGVFPDLKFFVVADGMGGHAAGEVASRMAVDSMREFIHLTVQPAEVTWPADLEANLALPIKRLVSAGKIANDKICQASRANPKQSGMGTTMVALLFEQDTAYVAHVGDSRAYLIRNGRIEQITQDHSLVNDYISQGLLKPDEAEQHPLKHVITRALGSNPKIDVDAKTVPLKVGDSVLLCSDGLSNLLTPDEIRSRALEASTDIRSACRQLIELANKKGGEDNITAILISSRENRPPEP